MKQRTRHWGYSQRSELIIPWRDWHYTATDPEHFQNFVLFTNYQFYVSEFENYARKMLADPSSEYTSFVSTGNIQIADPDAEITHPTKLPQMPSYHLKRPDEWYNLGKCGVGPSKKRLLIISLFCGRMRNNLGHCAGCAMVRVWVTLYWRMPIYAKIAC